MWNVGNLNKIRSAVKVHKSIIVKLHAMRHSDNENWKRIMISKSLVNVCGCKLCTVGLYSDARIDKTFQNRLQLVAALY